tara:strand:- start:1019 stop:1504 length:486 start_codon:yes stop_codon:yes gene_type:complete
MSKFNLKKFILEGQLDKNLQQLNENSPGYDTRKSGEPLPTLESVKAAYEAKNAEDKVDEEDRATRADKMMSGEYEDEDYKDSKRYADVRADLAPRKVGKSVKEQFSTMGEYVGKMDLDDHLDNIHYEFEKFQAMTTTEITDIPPAKEELISYVVDYLRNTL